MLNKVRSSLESAIEESEALLQEVETGPDKEPLRGACLLVKNRLVFGLSVTDSAASSDLTELREQVTSKTMKAPCKLWESLDTLHSVEQHVGQMFDDLSLCEDCDKEQVSDVTKKSADR